MNWWHVMRLFSWNHQLRRNYRADNLFDPIIGLWLSLLGYTIIVGCIYLTFWVFNLDDNKGSIFECIVGTIAMLSPGVAVIVTGLLITSFGNYAAQLSRVSTSLDISLQDMAKATPQEITAFAQRRLKQLAQELVEIEAISEDFFPERIEAKRRFEAAYEAALKAGIIEDVGYKSFFPTVK